MAFYNKLSELEVTADLTSWRFKVKIIRVYPYDVFGDVYWCYILADEDGTKTSMIIYPEQASRFTGFRDEEGKWVEKRLQDQQGKWVEIFRVNVEKEFTGFKPVDFPFKLTVFDGTRIKPIDPLNNHHYMEFKTIGQIRSADPDISTDVMGVVFNMEPIILSSKDRNRTELIFYIKDVIGNQIMCVAYGDTAYAFWDEYSNTSGMGVVIVVLRMWRIHKFSFGDKEPWLSTHLSLSDFIFNPQIEEVDDFRRQLANINPYGAIVPN